MSCSRSNTFKLKKNHISLKRRVPDIGMPLCLKVKIKIFLIFTDKDCNDTQHEECVFQSKFFFLLETTTIFTSSGSVTNYMFSNNIILNDTM